MSENRDPAIKLFGKTIPLRTSEEGGVDDDKRFPTKDSSPEPKNNEQEFPEDRSDHMSSMATEETKKPSSDDQETTPELHSKSEEQQNETSNNSQEKPLKKPDKILPCPRCNSLDTKFCYYNNYNVNQPRHFCKNCQRYWTAGGTMRNVPVGAGRRKNKNSPSSHYRSITVSDVPNLICHPPIKPNGTVLSFGSDAPLCESMASVLNLAEKTMRSCNRNGFSRTEEHLEEQSSGSSAVASNSIDEGSGGANLQEPVIQNGQFAPQVPMINGAPWPYPWNPPPGAFCSSTFPIPFYPAAAYWGCSTWSIPWLSPMASGSGSNSPTLGKHSREGNAQTRNSNEDEDSIRQSSQERSLWIPKTLRIDDPEEAAKSSIWATMGFKNDKADGISSSGGGLFKAFQTKTELKNHTMEPPAFYANPAAFSRSITFQEGS